MVRRWRNLPEFLHLNQISIWDVPTVFFIVVPEWRNFFEASDKRRDVAICTYRYTWNGTKKSM